MRDCGACRENVSKTFLKNKVPCGDLRSKPAPKKLVFVSLKFRQAQRNCLKLKRGSGNEDEKEEAFHARKKSTARGGGCGKSAAGCAVRSA
jgi:hypothetical protein